LPEVDEKLVIVGAVVSATAKAGIIGETTNSDDSNNTTAANRPRREIRVKPTESISRCGLCTNDIFVKG
jgi:hypothetical protein